MADCECCESIEIHEDLLKIVNETMPDENELYRPCRIVQGIR